MPHDITSIIFIIPIILESIFIILYYFKDSIYLSLLSNFPSLFLSFALYSSPYLLPTRSSGWQNPTIHL